MIVAGWVLIALSVVYWAIIEFVVSSMFNGPAILMAQAPISVSTAATFLAGIILIGAGTIVDQLRVNGVLARKFSAGYERPTTFVAGAVVHHQQHGVGVISSADGVYATVAFENDGSETYGTENLTLL